MDSHNDLFDIEESTFVKALAKFDSKIIDEVLDITMQNLDEFYESIRFKAEKMYCEMVIQLYKYIKQIQEEEN